MIVVGPFQPKYSIYNGEPLPKLNLHWPLLKARCLNKNLHLGRFLQISRRDVFHSQVIFCLWGMYRFWHYINFYRNSHTGLFLQQQPLLIYLKVDAISKGIPPYKQLSMKTDTVIAGLPKRWTNPSLNL